jgi:hypothetical protein
MNQPRNNAPHPKTEKISTKYLTLGNDHTNKVPSRVENPRTTWLKQHLKALIQQLGHRKQIVPQRLKKSNTPQSDLITHCYLTFGKHTPTPIVPKSDVPLRHHRDET